MRANFSTRIRAGLAACYANPFIDDVEDFVWESVWAYANDLPSPDPNRSKQLFDVVDEPSGRGWSAKTLVWRFTAETCEFVIQRADVFKKHRELGYESLSADSDPQDIGTAVLRHWKAKLNADAASQGVKDSRICVLFKNRPRTEFAILEAPLTVPEETELSWEWTNENRTGLQGRDADGNLHYRWYQNQKQLFEVLVLPHDMIRVSLDIRRFEPDEVISAMESSGLYQT